SSPHRARCKRARWRGSARIRPGSRLLLPLREVHPANHRAREQEGDQDQRDRVRPELLVRDPGARRAEQRDRVEVARPRDPHEEEGEEDEEEPEGDRHEEVPRVHGRPSLGDSVVASRASPGVTSSMIFRRVSMIPNRKRTGTAPAYTRIWIRNTNSERNRRYTPPIVTRVRASQNTAWTSFFTVTTMIDPPT